MDTKITLSFNAETINKAKKFAEDQNISLSRLTEFLYRQMTSSHYKNLDELPIADWVQKLAEGEAEYKRKPRSRKSMKDEFLSSKK
jgi:hypothetical protein